MSDKHTLDIIIPVYNEEECLPALFNRLLNVKERFMLQDVVTSFIFINDHSTDNSLNLLVTFCSNYDFAKIISFSRNFGHQIALTAGFDYSDADYTAVMDADLQDPPEVFFDMFTEAVTHNYDIVYGQRASRKSETVFKRITAFAFYRIINLLCDTEIPKDTGDFRLVSRRIVAEFRQMGEKHRFVRGMFPWLGFKQKALVYHRDERYAGETKYPLRKMISFAANAIFSFSNIPLVSATYIGLSVAFLGFLFSLYMLYIKFFTSESVSGVTSIILSIMIIGGVQITLLGILGQYVGRIFDEVKQRPLYIVERTINIGK